MPKCHFVQIEIDACWNIVALSATLNQGTGCNDPRKVVIVRPVPLAVRKPLARHLEKMMAQPQYRRTRKPAKKKSPKK